MPSSGSSKTKSGKSKHDNDANPDMSLPGIGNYTFERTIGQGNFAKVKLAKHKLTAQEVAIKIIDKTTLDEKKMSKLHREVRIMKMLNHPNIVKLFEVIETKHTLFLVMEYVSGGELYDYLVAHGRMKEKDARAKFRQILSAVSFCHKKNVIHRDLKAENLLLDSNLNIKIADFGFSNNYNPDGQLDTFCGSPPYAAPELFQGRKYTGPEVDIWSLGVILYVLCTGCLPFDGKDLKEMREVVCRGRYKVPFYLSDGCEKLLRKFLVRDPTKRSGLAIIREDAWINEGYTDSPITLEPPHDLAQEPDEEILKFMTDKFSIPRDQIVQCLQDNTYDDIPAIYLLLIDQKQNGKWTPYSTGVSPMSPVQLQTGTVNPISKSPNMATIGEDGDTANLRAPAAAHGQAQAPQPRERSVTMGANASSRQRPQTWVANDADVQKVMDDFAKQSIQNPNGQKAEGNGNISPNGTAQAAAGPPVVSAQERAMKRHSTYAPSEVVQPEEQQQQQQQATAAPPNQPAPKSRGVMGAIRSIGRRFSESTSSATAAHAAMAAGVQPGTEGEDKPRVLRFTFNSNTTSSKAPDDIIKEIVKSCTQAGVRFNMNGRFLVECSWYFKEVPLQKAENAKGNMDGERLQKALDEVMSGSSSNIAAKDMKDVVRFDIEVCELPRLKNLHGLRFKRIGGPSAEYKEICGRILGAVEL